MKPVSELVRLEGKAAIVTGGSKGIGQAIAYRLAEAGAKVLVADIDRLAAEATAKELQNKGWTAAACTVDVADEAQVQAMVQACAEQFGGVDILVNNAGIFPLQSVSAMAAADFDHVLAVNLRGAFLATKYSAEQMKTRGGGKIINITSVDALHPSMVGLAHYDASKHGMWGFTKNTALEYAHDNIWINAIAPGGVATPGVAAMNPGGTSDNAASFLSTLPMKRMGESDEIARVVLFVASDLCTYATGSQFVIDGGALLV